MDPLSQKAVGAALHDGGEFDEEAFVARYGKLPERRGHGGYWSYYARDHHLFPLDLFFCGGIPREMKPFLDGLAPAPEPFQLEGLAEAPETLDIDEQKIPLHRADTERAGPQDLMAYLELVQHGALKHSASSHLLTPKSVRTLFDNLLDGDFAPHEETVTAKGSIRPFGLDVFARESGLAGRYIGEEGEAVLLYQDVEALLDAFETWIHEGTFDELGRVRAVKGQNARHTHLTEPAKRREKIVEALSWCPVGVWIPISDFNRALKIWHHDFDLDLDDYSNLYVDNPIFAQLRRAMRPPHPDVGIEHDYRSTSHSAWATGSVDAMYRRGSPRNE